mmetsp:Transcript_97381/g.270886  ORF Transcript_97381/g.270886 Transcript_97381/m.270886 type:complete len:240 (-) Transcript_97381:346-1065(-)
MRMHACEATWCPFTSPGTLTHVQLDPLFSVQAHSGYGLSTPKTALPNAQLMSAAMMIVTTTVGRPLPRKSRTRRGRKRSRDFANAMILLGCAVGRANTREHATVVGNIRRKGCITAHIEAHEATGIMKAAATTDVKPCAKMAVTSVKTKQHVRSPAPFTSQPNFFPITMSRPDSTAPSASPKPPPMRSSTPHWTFSPTSTHVRRAWPLLTEGKKKSTRPHAIARVLPFIRSIPFSFLSS